MQNEFIIKLWNEPYPDHSFIHSWIAKTLRGYHYNIEDILHNTAIMCINESGWNKKGIIATDSSGVETDRYDKKIKPIKHKKRFENKYEEVLKAYNSHMII